MSDEESAVGSKTLEGVSNDDFSRAEPGDTLQTSVGEHEVDETAAGPRESGAAQSTGSGGDRVWRDDLLPSEKEVLKRYFK